ncbi:hypothetical protein ABL78_5098 [Leptomonas seymouri]|uniref:C3H1-type domain-containing protein n=1 Tax=Leptomonas seymouri TaxID=5684 RepID=A0A0N1I3Y1_LEPSE|nr:hypothetical protein ABL78_5098 [Leptomonas seymouri]|eukprot:KPI85844.1 hypothetical protein ABL78_5098 [Leptomonas seymouri]
MPKANKHAEVKPSKYKTSLCQFFLKGAECPFAGRCAFAHGEHELQTESKNVEVLKATGLQRLDGVQPIEVKEAAVKTPTSVSTNSFTASVVSDSLVLSETTTPTSPMSPVVRPRRRTVMVSLPKQNTRNETYQSPYSSNQYDPCYSDASRAEYGYPSQQPIHVYRAERACTSGLSGSALHEGQFCDCRFSATCSQGQPLKYRHNPYGMTGRIPQCA